jgi:hypothetical protein
MADAKIKEAENKIKKEQIEKHKLLNDLSEIKRNAALVMYNKYVKMSAKERR